MNKHTQGTWQYTYLPSVVTDCDGEEITLARVDPDCALVLEEAIANAHLMAAAPDLLAACKIALDALGCDRIRQDRLEAQRIINAAISAAEGTEQRQALSPVDEGHRAGGER